MGLRYRKSINLGGGFRINLSKSGIGYSWGVKGYRITKTARGTVRTTVSIPGTGVSYVSESRKRQAQNQNRPTPQNVQPTQPYSPQTFNGQTYENARAEEISSAAVSDILDAAKKTLTWNSALIICLIVSLVLSFVNPLFLLSSIVFLVLFIFVRIKGVVKLDYCISDDQVQAQWNARMGMLYSIASSQKLWRILSSGTIVDQKRNAGAQNAVNRVPCDFTCTLPFPFKANIRCISLSTKKEALIFLPDMLLIKQGKTFGALTYHDLSCRLSSTAFIEEDGVPRDAVVIGQTWKYVNKSGGPDRRFKDNRQLPICKYGELILTGPGLNTIFMFSKPVQ